MQYYKRRNFSFLLIGGVFVMACRKASSFPDIPMLLALLCALSLALMANHRGKYIQKCNNSFA